MNNDKERFYEAESKTQVSLGSAEAKKRSDEIQLFRKALQRQNERAAGLKMPDDMEQRVMERIRPKKVIRRWLYPSIATIAASVLLLLVFRFSQWPVEEQPIVQQPVVAETIEQSTPQPVVSEPIVEEKQEDALPEVQPTPQPVKKRRKAVKKQSTPIEEPLLAEAEPVTEAPARDYSEERFSNPSNPYLLATAQLQDLRSRGERLDREVAMMMHN